MDIIIINLINSHPWIALAIGLGLIVMAWALRPVRVKGFAQVVDGDSLVIGKLRCRLAGVDAPEHNQPLGPAARKALADLIADRPVSCKVLGTDHYRRRLIVCRNHKGQDVARELVRQGLAVVYGRRTRNRARRYWFVQLQARLMRRGMWGQKSMRPERWRSLNR